MIPRYSRNEMSSIWTAENRFRIWFDIEPTPATLWQSWESFPPSRENIRKKGKWEIARIDEIEKTTRHDVLASSPILPNISAPTPALCIRA